MSLSENSLSSVLCDVITEIIMCFGYNTQNEMYNLRDRLNDIAIDQYIAKMFKIRLMINHR